MCLAKDLDSQARVGFERGVGRDQLGSMSRGVSTAFDAGPLSCISRP